MNPVQRLSALFALAFAASGCSDAIWNDPHPSAGKDQVVLYSNFSERPKHLDPARSYSSDESNFIDQIYEPPLQYHYLKRPYELEPATLTKMPELYYLDEQGQRLPDDAKDPAYSVYDLTLKPGIMYQPHPSFARNDDGSFYYDFASAEDSQDFKTLHDFTEMGTQELIADDYIYQIKRLADPKRLAPLRGLLSKYIVGMKEFSEEVAARRENMGSNDWLDLRELEMAGLEKVDDYRFRIKLKGEYPQFQYWLAFHFFAPVPWEVDRFYHLPGLPERNITLDWHPVGTGAFMMVENNPNSQIVLQRNPNFRDDYYPTEGMPEDQHNGLLADAGKQVPFIDRAVYRLEKEAIPIWTKFMQGYYDRSGISNDSFDQAVDMSSDGINLSDDMRAKGVHLDKATRPSTFYLGMNMLDPVVGGDSERARKLRQAVAIAYDTEEFIQIFLNGRGEPGMSPVPPGIFGHQIGEEGINSVVYDWVDGKPQRKSIEEAKRLLAEAGYPDGRDAQTGEPLVLNLDITSTSSTKARLAWMQKQFNKIDLQLNIRATDYNRFKEKLETGNAQIFFFGWLADYPDPENFLFLLHGPNAQVDSKSGVNATNFKNARYDELFAEMKLLPSGPERMEVIREMIDILRTEAPWTSMFHGHDYMLNNAWVSNSKLHGISKATLKYIKIDPQLRQEKQAEWNKPNLLPLILVILLLAALIVPAIMVYQRRQKQTIGE
ncbi:peptide ABC transporter substrate-binding protein [Bacterioplanes sanyensis]|uniref:Peptide ABC transporter substrate-binding protein n=1 Tax=Bacterioplanes sanyensis TaxID=1249553 RepID=A0A222FNW2_9GAMM|nr:ABC transporter substrate-binding protein [Bacterioplanes sanyensis]ASP40226.1 peptide ABC transporter substrate-binding protein [Bacterioplanes sanyensis]